LIVIRSNGLIHHAEYKSDPKPVLRYAEEPDISGGNVGHVNLANPRTTRLMTSAISRHWENQQPEPGVAGNFRQVRIKKTADAEAAIPNVSNGHNYLDAY
jgi:hypothetical protein